MFAPVAILLHELGHWFALAALGCPAQIHFAYTTPRTAIPGHLSWLVVAAGPAVTGVMMFGGFFLLLGLRRGRLQDAVTRVDWLATFPALCAVRWLRFGTASIVLPQPNDEATLSKACGFPAWVLPLLRASCTRRSCRHNSFTSFWKSSRAFHIGRARHLRWCRHMVVSDRSAIVAVMIGKPSLGFIDYRGSEPCPRSDRRQVIGIVISWAHVPTRNRALLKSVTPQKGQQRRRK